MTPPNDEKARLRASAKEARARAFAGKAGEASLRLAGFARELGIEPGQTVSGYFPLTEEIDPRPLMIRLHEAGARLALPSVAAWAKPLHFRLWSPGDALIPGRHGTREPSPESALARPDVLLVPLLAFDCQGHRLGYGGGFYDRTLEELRRNGSAKAIGLAFAEQELAAIPAEPFDQPLDAMLTDAGYFTFDGRR
jgi:5-formyltetrahydrofolate cyclo-ligase